MAEMQRTDHNLSRRDFFAAAALAAFSFGTACEKKPEPPTVEEMIAQLTDRETQKAMAIGDLGLKGAPLESALQGKSKDLVDKLLVAYGAALTVEMLEGTYRPQNNIAAKILLTEMVVHTNIILRGVSKDCSQKFKDLKAAVEELQLSTISLVKKSNRTVAAAAERAQDLALKLDQHPTFSWKTSANSAVGNLLAGAPTAGNFRSLKESLQEAVFALTARD